MKNLEWNESNSNQHTRKVVDSLNVATGYSNDVVEIRESDGVHPLIGGSKFKALMELAGEDGLARGRRAIADEMKADKLPITFAYLRFRAGLSQKDLADRIQTSQSALSLIESGKREPGITIIPLLKKALGCSSDEIITTIENIPSKELQ